MRRLFLLVCAVVLVDTAFYAAIVPVLPHYSEELDLSKSAAGILTASYAAGTLVGAIPAGWLASRVGVKPILIFGLCLMSVTSVVFGLASNIVVLDVTRFIQGVAGACSWAAGMAWLVGMAPAERRGELIGSSLSAAIVGMLLGPVIGGMATVVGDVPVFSAVALIGLGLAAWAATMPGVPPAEGRRACSAPSRRYDGPPWRRPSGCSSCPRCSRACSRCSRRCDWTNSARAAWRSAPCSSSRPRARP